MKQFRACFCIASMIGLFGCVTNVFAVELPLKAKALVGEFEKNMKQTRKAFASELQEWRNAVVLELKSVQKQLAELRSWMRQFLFEMSFARWKRKLVRN